MIVQEKYNITTTATTGISTSAYGDPMKIEMKMSLQGYMI